MSYLFFNFKKKNVSLSDIGILRQTEQIVVIAVSGGSVILNAVLIVTVCVICCANCKRRKECSGQIATNPILFNVIQNNIISSSSSQNVHLADFIAPHDVSTFQPARKPVQNHEMIDTGT